MSAESRRFAPYLGYALNALNDVVANDQIRANAVQRLGAMVLGEAVPPPLGIEIPLAGPGPGIDLSVGYATGFGNREYFDRCAMVNEWIDPHAPDLLSAFDNIWLEHDLIAPQSRHASLYFSPRLIDRVQGVPTKLSAEHCGAICSLVTSLAPRLVLSDIHQIKDLLGAYSDPHAYVLCGVMTGREKARVRLIFRFESLTAAQMFLSAQDFGDHDAGLEWLDKRFGALVDRVLVGCEIGNESALGVEFYAPDGLLQPGNADDRMISILETSGLCHTDKGVALRSYPGREALVTGVENWDHVVKRDGLSQGRIQVPVCERRLHHIKVGLQDGTPVQAKAYMSALFRWWFR